ncbi:helix-turn-helix transcriptional regulator [Streptomyces monashensis]|uniref:helix-turn-helix domain-containing protein n=1 Tax=Streptomyces monashensis TaxID=1678012 RepID=UPI0033E047EB
MPPEHGPPKPSHEGELIRLARQARGLSPEEAADRTPIRIKGFRWRQIENGYKGKVGSSDPVRAPAKTLAHMAYTVGVTPTRLTEVSRSDAAKILREIQIQKAGETASLPDPLDILGPERQRIILDMLGQLSPEDRGPALRRLAERVEAGELDAGSDAEATEVPQVPDQPYGHTG